MQSDLVMNPTRRGVLKFIGGGIAIVSTGGLSLLTAGCGTETTAQILNDIFNWTNTGLDAFNGVVTLLENAGVLNPVTGAPITMLITTIQAGLAQVKADVQAYQAITPPPVGALAKIEDALQIVATNFQAFLASINTSNDVLLKLVVGAITLILDAIAGFVGQLGPVTPALKTLGTQRRLKLANGSEVTITPHVYSVRAFKRAYNANMRAGGHSEIQLKLTVGEHLAPDWL